LKEAQGALPPHHRRAVQDGVGAQLTQANLAVQIATYRVVEASLAAAHKQDVARIAALIKPAQ
jgi:hypothetical protein